ncbi:MAG: SRPBCC domain-containing protein [Myxococcaceae bacterium]|nr:SRPBCC domain-containing protein [Myxococcaceae bacterium]
MSRARRVGLGVASALGLGLFAASFASFEVRADVVIDAPPEAVWAVVVDLPGHGAWNHQLKHLGGTVAVGEPVRLKLSADGAEPYEFSADVTHLDAPTHFAWLGRTGLPRVFDGHHHFELERLSDGRTKLVNRERYSGVLAPLMERLPMMAGAQAGFATMNAELKRHVEAQLPNHATQPPSP